MLDRFLTNVIRLVADPNPSSRHSTGIWLLALVKNCPKHPSIVKRKETLQYAFTELLSDDSGNVDEISLPSIGDKSKISNHFALFTSEFVQDVASRGLGLVYELSDPSNQCDLANSLLNQMFGGKRQVKQVNADSVLFEEGVLGKTPTGYECILPYTN